MTRVLHGAAPPVPAPLVRTTMSRLVTGLRLLLAVLLLAGVLSTAPAAGAIPDQCPPRECPIINTGDSTGDSMP